MSISEQITALQTDKTNIRNAILNKGGTCPSGNGFDDFATDIGTIQTGYTITSIDNGDGTQNLVIADGVSNLPYGYQEVEWIASSGTQNIQIPYSIPYGYSVTMDMEFISSSSRTLVGASTGTACYFGKSTSNILEMGGSVTINVNPTSRMKINFYRSDGVGYLSANNTTVNRSGSFPSTGNWNLFGISGYMGSGAKIYDAYISSGGVFYHLIPCYRTSDSVIGMYDIINNVFYQNSGSGTFTKGGNV